MKTPSQRLVLIDYFDTTVFRDVTEDKFKQLWAESLSSKMNYHISSEDILKARLMVEHNLSLSGKDAVSKYEDIMKKVFCRLNQYSITDYCEEDEFICEAKELEIALEIKHQYSNKQVIDMLNDVKRKGHHVVLVSDFYFGWDVFNRFLNDLSISAIFDKLYISCDYGKSKADGSLYKAVLEEQSEVLGREYIDDSIMIGDKYISDYCNSTKNGVSASIHYKTKNKKLTVDCIKELNKLYNTKNKLSNYAFALYLYCDQLFKYCVDNEITHVYFLSREGQFLMRLFEEYISNKVLINTSYLFVSRNSTFLPSLKTIEEEDFSRLLSQYNGKISINTFLKNLQFTDDEICGFGISDIDKTIAKIQDDTIYKRLISNDFFLEQYESKRKKAIRNFKGYLKSSGITEGSNFCLADVGWKGTMQDNIWNLFSGDVGITGLYLGYSNEGEVHANSKKLGMLFDYVNIDGCNEISSDIFAFNSFLYEMLLVADHGKTSMYSDDYLPIIIDDDDVEMYRQYVHSIQQSIYSQFQSIVRIKKETILTKKEILLFEELHGRLFKSLGLRDISYLDNMILLHRDGFGNKKSGSAVGSYASRLLKLKLRPYLRMKGYYCSKNGVKK